MAYIFLNLLFLHVNCIVTVKKCNCFYKNSSKKTSVRMKTGTVKVEWEVQKPKKNIKCNPISTAKRSLVKLNYTNLKFAKCELDKLRFRQDLTWEHNRFQLGQRTSVSITIIYNETNFVRFRTQGVKPYY